MVENAITLGPNCKKLEHDWAFVALTRNQEVEAQFRNPFACMLRRNFLMQHSFEAFCNFKLSNADFIQRLQTKTSKDHYSTPLDN